MKKKSLSILLALCMIFTLLPVSALAAGNTYTESRFGLTVTQTDASSQGFSLGVKTDSTYSHVYDAYVAITQSGTYTISGTYNDISEAGNSTFTGSFVESNPSGMRGIIDVTNAPEGSNITLILENLTIETDYWQTPPILLRRQSDVTDAINVTIKLVGNNTLANNATANGGGAIVKQDGNGNLTFTGDGNLMAKARDVAIGAPIIYYANDNFVSSDCSNITFAQTGSITAQVLLGTGTPVGVSGDYRNGTRSVTASNITVQSGTLNLVNTYSGTLSSGAMLGASGRFNSFSNIQVTGGTITTSTPNATIGSQFYSIGGYSMESDHGVHISGGTIVSSLLPRAQDTRSGASAYDYAYGAYVATSDTVSSLSARVDGEAYTYTAAGVEPQGGKVWLWLPLGNAAVTLNSTNYYGVVDSSNNTELKQDFNPVTGIIDLPTEMSANSTLTLAGVVSPTDATFNNAIEYELLDAGTTGATLSGSTLTALAGGTARLRASVAGGAGNGEMYVQDFSVAVRYTAITDITGIPDRLQNGTTVTLAPSLTPSDASYRTIAWSVKSGSATLSGSRLTPTEPGTVVLTATVANGSAYGTAYTKDFTITVPYIAVTDVTASIPSTLTINENLALSGTVAPSEASYRSIVWSVPDAGETGASIMDGTLTATAAGTLTLRATVADGLGAGQDFTKDYSIQVIAATVLNINLGSVTITPKDDTTNTVTFVGYSGGSNEVPKSETIAITGTNTGSKITVDGTTAAILLQNVSLTSAGDDSCIDLKNGASLTMSAAGSNTLTAAEGISGSSSAAIHVPTGTALTVEDGGGSLSVYSQMSAGIGGNGASSGDGETAGTIMINGGTVTASSQYGAAIGGGPSFGGGTAGAGGNITIAGGTVTANNQFGAAIGGGYSLNGAGGASGSITITGGTVTAASSQAGAAIGGGGSQGTGTGGAGGAITISGGIVTATSTYFGAAIGGGGFNGDGTPGAGGTIAISGGTVTAKASSWEGARAIGSGINDSSAIADNGTLRITGGSIITNRSITGATSDSTSATSDGSTKVYKTTVDLSETVGANTALTSASSIDGYASYGFNDVMTDGSGKLYLYLPENASRTATLNGTAGYTGSTKADDSGVLTLSGLSASLELGTPYLTDRKAAVSATPNLAGTIYYMAVKGGAADAYASADALKNASGVKSASAMANTALTLTGMTALEGDYTIFAALISASGSSKSAVMAKSLSVPATAPTSSDATIDYSGEKLKAASDGYSLQYFTAADATTGGTPISTSGVPIADFGSTIYIRKVFSDGSVGGKALAFAIPARPDAPAAPPCTAAATAITVAATGGVEYSIDNTDWNNTGSFTNLTAVKNYTVYARTAATAGAFASEPVSTTVSTVAAVNTPTKVGAGAAFAGNTVTADRTTVGVGESVTYTITATGGYTPSLSINSGAAVTLGDAGSGTYTYTYTPTEGTESISAVVTFDGAAIDQIEVASVTLFADDARNASQTALETYLGGLKATAKDRSGTSLGTVAADFALKTGTWAATGGSYTYTATAGGKTCDVAVLVKAVNSAITAVSPISLMAKPTEGYATHSAIGLPDTVTVTYTGDGYTPKTDTLDVTWSAVPADFGKTTTETPAAFAGTIALPAWATGTNTATANVMITPSALPLSGTLAISGGTTAGSTVTAALASDSGTPVKGSDYRVQWYRVSSGTAIAISGANDLAYRLTDGDLGKTLKVELIADANDSLFYGTVSQTLEVPAVKPAAPVLIASAGSGKVTLGWSAPFDGGSPLTGYKLYVKSGSGGYGAGVEMAADATNYEVGSLSTGTTYTFKLEAINAVGSTESAEATATPRSEPSGGSGGGSGGGGGGGIITPTYTITTSAGEGGSFDTAQTVSLRAGESAGFNIKPNAGYVIADVKVDGKSLGAVSYYVFDNVTANHTISAVFKEDGNAQGGDTTTITYTITTSAGTGGSFDPAQTVSVRAGESAGFNIKPNAGYAIADVKVDGRSVGAVSRYAFDNVTANHTISAAFEKTNPQTDIAYDFTDVPASAWYYQPVMTACNNGWFSGTSATTFNPNTTTTRSMIVTVLWRMEGQPTARAGSFTDVATDSYYAPAVAWAAEHGIAKGYGDGTFGSDRYITREQMATILYRYAQYKGYDLSGAADLSEFTDSTQVSDFAMTATQWAVAHGIISGTGNQTLDPKGNATRAQVVTVLVRFAGEYKD